MKFVIGLLLGLSLMLVAGAAVEHYYVTLDGDFEKVGVYRPSFSGINSDGVSYLAITNTVTGETEVFGFQKDTIEKFNNRSFQRAQEGSVIIKIQRTP